MKFSKLWGLVSLLLTLSFAAQAAITVEGDLPRRADLGFRVSEDGGTLSISKVVEETPAASAGLQTGDIILTINDQPVERDFIGVDILRRLDGGKTVSLTLSRGGMETSASFTPPPLPFVDPEGTNTLYNGFRTSDGSHLRTALSHREDLTGPLPTVVLIQWVSCGVVTDRMVSELQTVQNSLPVAIFRVERAANGDSEGPACHDLDYDTEIQNYAEAILDIAENPNVDAAQIYLYGSSLGSTEAPLVARELKRRGLQVAGLMIQGGGAVSYVERMMNFDRINLERKSDRDFKTLYEDLQEKILFQTEYLIKGRHPDEVALDSPEMKRARNSILGLGEYTHYGRPYVWHQQAAKHDFLEAWLEVAAPTLVAFAEFDQFEMRHGHKMIVEVLDREYPGLATYVELPNINHFNDFHTDIDQAYFRAEGVGAIDLLASHMVKWLGQRLD